MISCASPKAQYIPYKEEIDTAILNVLDSGTYILGEQVSLFEREFAEYLGANFTIGCGSGTDALALALKALDIGSGDEVIVPSFTATPTAAAVVMAGAKPVFADIEPDFYTLDVNSVEAACDERTRAIIAVHLYGQAADLDALQEIAQRRGIHLIEDCAQAAGASYRGRKLGSFGDVGCFSFFPTKNLGAIGDGGAVVCSDAGIAARLRRLRQYGWDEHRISQEPGINSRLDELQAAVLRVKLRHLDADNAERRQQAARYRSGLIGLPIDLPAERQDALHVYHLFVIRTQVRDRLMQHLMQNDIFAGIHYAKPVHMMPAFRDESRLPVTERIVGEIISLPLYSGLDVSSQLKILSTICGLIDVRSA